MHNFKITTVLSFILNDGLISPNVEETFNV